MQFVRNRIQQSPCVGSLAIGRNARLRQRDLGRAQSLRGADEFNLPAAKGAVRRKRTVRGVLVGSAATVAVLAIGAGAWAGYGAWRVGPATSQSPSATPSGSEKPSASPSPSVTPSDEHQIVSGADVEILERLEHPCIISGVDHYEHILMIFGG